jgi:hypothetical protein
MKMFNYEKKSFQITKTKSIKHMNILKATWLCLILFTSTRLSAQNSPFTIYGAGLNGTTYQQADIYADVANGFYFDAPKDAAGNKLSIQFNWRGGNASTSPLFIQGSNSFVGIGTTSPSSKLHVVGAGSNLNVGNPDVISGDLVVQSNTGGRNTSRGAALEFVIPANTDGSNLWGQGRIMTVPGDANSGSAAGKLVLGTRRYWQKPGTFAAAWNYGDDLTIDSQGNIGVGTLSPARPLHINNTGGGIVRLQSLTAIWDVQSDAFYNGNYGVVNYTGGYADATKSFVINGTTGYFGIGTSLPDSKLAVKGQVHANEVKVDLNVPGPDYVFEKDYKLTSLEEIKNYIDQNKHLPEVPSAKEMEKNGVQLGEMNMLLLKKIEELTLYVIELKKRDDESIMRSREQQKQIDELKSKIR